MICFELLTGKVPFEDNHLQGDKTSKNIRAGERPLFPFQTPKYLTVLTKRCWHAEPAQRPGFSSVCRVLRYVKRFLVMNPEQQQQAGQADAPVAPPVDYLDVEMQLLRRLPAWLRGEGARVSDVPFQMFAYRVVEREKTATVLHTKDKASDSGSEGNSLYGDENGLGAMSPDHASNGTVRALLDCSDGKKPPTLGKKADGKASNSKQAGTLRHSLLTFHRKSSSSTVAFHCEHCNEEEQLGTTCLFRVSAEGEACEHREDPAGTKTDARREDRRPLLVWATSDIFSWHWKYELVVVQGSSNAVE
jgi:serine/threonine protein kinase